MSKYIIEALQDDDTWDNTGEGPFDTRDEACRFAEAEVGARYRIVEVPTPMHTPGPWEAWNQHRGVILREWRVGERNSTPGIVRPIAVVSGDQRDGDEQVANARLIAAAPELLAALERIARMDYAGQKKSDGAHLADIARAAIAKAKGDQPSA